MKNKSKSSEGKGIKYTCQKCGIEFKTDNKDLDEDSALCNKCWRKLVDYTHDYSKSAEDRFNYHLTYLKK